ncbi:MAG: DUF58 domain-containing protein [Actinomycetota bacterium]|nr:DUF58 domain-containing protein [Actinomycetota bacterium]
MKSYVGISALCLFLALVTGRLELAVIAAPLLVAVVGGALATSAPNLDLAVVVDAQRVVEGDELLVNVIIVADRSWPEVELAMAVPGGFRLLSPEQPVVFSLRAPAPSKHAFRLQATRWGPQRVGLVGVRVRGPGRLFEFEQVIDRHLLVKVYPSYERVDRSLPPVDTQTYAGDYVARSAGDGIEFASVRPFTWGDSIRRVNWRVTSRRTQLHVNLAQPERNADVVLFLDTFSDVHLDDDTTLDLTVRGAAAIARHHLRHHDRIGLVSFGGALRWLTASMGRLHAYRVADFLIDVGATFSFVWKEIELLPQRTLPPGAIVIAFSPLVDDRTMKALADLNQRGFFVYVINTLVEDRIAASEGPEGQLAYRAWRLQRTLKRDRLKEAGIPVVDWNGSDALEVAMSALPSRGRRLGARR